ncbi:cysteine hydrolase family protein [Haloarchaeobius sp. HME9146]|uniref:cysteine hydrolase family protein n=1 Tax=Haloarchaeobius sp. HME9146 TaxID=2978732 RepID=UPI0021C05668|nr:isochorismatase family cysteine hydrolase [Haloarchaeobius sp. HME9146]MCT9097084.1 cysteine hydrolase [Haloarchaeobius sp. HME9146]
MPVTITPERTALLITDPQVDFLKPESVVWDHIGETVEENDVVEHLVQLRDAAREGGITVFYSPHYYDADEYESWQHLNPIDEIMFDTRMFDLAGSGSEFIPELEPGDDTVVCAPHKQLSGFWSNDINTQLRQRGIDTIVLAGMSANLCVESHLRDAVEAGFEVLVVTDATAAAGKDALEAAYTNYGFIAHETATTEEVVARLSQKEVAPADD